MPINQSITQIPGARIPATWIDAVRSSDIYSLKAHELYFCWPIEYSSLSYTLSYPYRSKGGGISPSHAGRQEIKKLDRTIHGDNVRYEESLLEHCCFFGPKSPEGEYADRFGLQ